LQDLFDYYMEHPEEIGIFSRQRAEKIGWPRAICDYLAGMTDRYAIDDHKRLFGA
jgi:dGTPase